MSLDPQERLAALRREVERESRPPHQEPETPPQASDARDPGEPQSARSSRTLATGSQATHAASIGDATATAAAAEASAADDRSAWDLPELLADTSLTTWLGIGLLAVGGYLVLSWFVPGIDLVGSLIILAAGVVLLAQHFGRGARSWSLYSGAILTGIGAARLIGDILPGSPHGLTAMGIGVALLVVSYLRHSQAGGYGWQGIAGGVALGLGLLQFALGLLPGSPAVIDLLLPAMLVVGGVLLLGRTRRSTPGGPSR